MQISFLQFKIQFDFSGGRFQVVMLTSKNIAVDLSIQLQLYL